MRAKKLLALALAGMALTTCLSGCDRTIIEHQFHTDTVTNTENVVSVIDTLEGIRKLSAFFKSLDRDVSMIQMHDYEEKFNGNEIIEKGVDMDEVEDFVQAPTTNGIVLIKEYDRQSDYSGFFAISDLFAVLTLLCTLSACAPNVEHRFDTTEYSAQAEATMRSISRELARMDSLLASHNADLDAAFARYEDGKPGRPEGNVADTTITQDALNDWAARPGRELYVYVESGTTIEEYLSVWYGQLGDVYSALNSLTAEQWENLDGETVSVTGMLVKAGGKTYVETEVTCA